MHMHLDTIDNATIDEMEKMARRIWNVQRMLTFELVRNYFRKNIPL